MVLFFEKDSLIRINSSKFSIDCRVFGIFKALVIINARHNISVNDNKYEYANSPIDLALNRKKAIDAIKICDTYNNIRRTFLFNGWFSFSWGECMPVVWKSVRINWNDLIEMALVAVVVVAMMMMTMMIATNEHWMIRVISHIRNYFNFSFSNMQVHAHLNASSLHEMRIFDQTFWFKILIYNFNVTLNDKNVFNRLKFHFVIFTKFFFHFPRSNECVTKLCAWE